MAERTADGEQLVFTDFDPAKGRGREFARFDIGPNTSFGRVSTQIRAPYVWDLSPDGARIAVLKGSGAQIYTLSLNSRAVLEIAVKGWNSFEGLDRAADGKGLFVSSPTREGSALLYVDLRGAAHVLWEQKGLAGARVVPSPDGGYLALVVSADNRNLWMMENF